MAPGARSTPDSATPGPSYFAEAMLDDASGDFNFSHSLEDPKFKEPVEDSNDSGTSFRTTDNPRTWKPDIRDTLSVAGGETVPFRFNIKRPPTDHEANRVICPSLLSKKPSTFSTDLYRVHDAAEDTKFSLSEGHEFPRHSDHATIDRRYGKAAYTFSEVQTPIKTASSVDAPPNLNSFTKPSSEPFGIPLYPKSHPPSDKILHPQAFNFPLIHNTSEGQFHSDQNALAHDVSGSGSGFSRAGVTIIKAPDLSLRSAAASITPWEHRQLPTNMVSSVACKRIQHWSPQVDTVVNHYGHPHGTEPQFDQIRPLDDTEIGCLNLQTERFGSHLGTLNVACEYSYPSTESSAIVKPIRESISNSADPKDGDKRISHAGKAKRTRRIIEPVKGNNPYGRGGTWACRPCRNRRWKCVYTTFRSPCQLCIAQNELEPCIKLTAAEYNPSRVLQTTNGPRRSDTEQLLLEYVNSEEFASTYAWDSTFLTQLVKGFGQLPSHVSLRHANYALAAFNHPQKQCQAQFGYHKKLALRTLEQRIKDPGKLVEQDFFGAALLIYALAAETSRDETLTDVTKKFIFLHRHLSKSEHLYDMFAQFGAAAVDTVADTVCVSDPFSGPLAILRSCLTTYSQRVTYESICRRLSRTPEAWQSDTVEALFFTAMHSAWLILNCLCYVAKKEFQQAFVDQDIVTSVVQSIADRFADPEFLIALQLEGEQLQTNPRNILNDEQVLVAHSQLGMQGVQLLINLLSAPTISTGLDEAQMAYSGADLIEAALRLTDILPETFPINHYPQVTYWYCNYLVIGACMLPPAECYECKCRQKLLLMWAL